MITDEEVLLHGFDGEDRESFLAMGKEERFEANELIIEETAPGSSLHIILDGVVGIWKRHVRLSTATRGAVVGEMAIFRPQARSATVRAESPVRTLKFEKADVMAFFKWRDERLFKILAINMIHIVARKLARTNELVSYLQSQLQSRDERGPVWVRTSIL